MARVTDLVTKVIQLNQLVSTVDGSTRVGRTYLHQLTSRIKSYIHTIWQIVLSSIYEVKYEVCGKPYMARLTNITESEVKGVIIAHFVSLGFKATDINFLEIKRIPTFFSGN